MSDYEYQGNELGLFASAVNWKSYFASLLRPYIRGRVLEVGAGIGATMQALWNSEVSNWLCLEPDLMLAGQLSLLVNERGDRTIESLAGTVDDLAPGRRFDCILYIDVLEHIRDDRTELQRASRFLDSGGHLVVLSPAFQFLYSPFDKALGHERRYTARSLSEAFPADLAKERVFYADSVGALASLSNRLLLRKELPSLRQIQFWDRAIIPVSRMLDPLARRWFGRSVIGIYSRADATAGSRVSTT